jgi:hypothetical protein
MDNRVFLGASLDSGGHVFFGQSLLMMSRTIKGSSDGDPDEITTMELGPRFTFFFDDAGTWKLSLAWHPYAKGERKRAGETEDISGSAYLASFGFQARFGRSFYLGASINYHSLSITKSTDTSNVEEEVSHSYTTIIPMIDFAFRFR